MRFFPIFVLFMVQSTWGYIEENYYPTQDVQDNFLYDDYDDNDVQNPMVRRSGNKNFLRFGRSENPFNPEYEDYDDMARPTRSGQKDKNDLFLRFGRNRQEFIRFGRDDLAKQQPRIHRDSHLRLGRSSSEQQKNKRSKRDTSASGLSQPEVYSKRAGSGFIRFGRNGNQNFMRFGRMFPTPETDVTNGPEVVEPEVNDMMERLKLIQGTPLVKFLADLAEIRREYDIKKYGS